MIRLTFLLKRKSNFSFVEFQSYWREYHAPLVASVCRELNIKRYVQVHTLVDPDESVKEGQRGPMQRPYDGVAELWFGSTEALYASSKAARVASAKLLEDEHSFIDLERSPGWIGYEIPHINPTPENIVAENNSPIVKFYYPLNHPLRMNLTEVQAYWRMQHGPLVRKYGSALQILRYIQVHRIDHEFNQLFAKSRGITVSPYFGHAELWYNQNNFGLKSPESKRGALALYEDEAKFIEFEQSSLWFGKEHVIFDRR